MMIMLMRQMPTKASNGYQKRRFTYKKKEKIQRGIDHRRMGGI